MPTALRFVLVVTALAAALNCGGRFEPVDSSGAALSDSAADAGCWYVPEGCGYAGCSLHNPPDCSCPPVPCDAG